MVTVCAVLSTLERAPLAAAGDGWFETLHAGTLRQALRAARQRRVDALVVSVQVCRGEAQAVARFMSEFPAIATVALVSQHDSAVSETLLHLGASGVRLAVDCTAPAGWRQLRHLVALSASPEVALILTGLRPALVDATGNMRAFLETLARFAPRLPNVGKLARRLCLPSSTLIARFRRARPSPPQAHLPPLPRLPPRQLLSAPRPPRPA